MFSPLIQQATPNATNGNSRNQVVSSECMQLKGYICYRLRPQHLPAGRETRCLQ